ncbi:MAG: DUF1844 domain-containing protein [Syntrophobacterales bacterium]|nr:DUF1844 domain-containing protein [Syntrophobacterales bacterium]
MTENDSEKGFVIKDRRMFDEDGGTRADVVREDEKKEPVRKPETGNEKVERETTVEEEEKKYQLPEMNFHNFVLSLYTSVLFNLGELANPVSDKREKDLEAAKQTIDILGILKEKTEGNLDSSEKELLDGVLSESRMKYVKESENP